MALTPITLFAVVQRDINGDPFVAKVQCNPVRTTSDVGAVGTAWTLDATAEPDFNGHLKLAGADDGGTFVWTDAWVGLDIDDGLLTVTPLPADRFLQGDTITVMVTPEGQTAVPLDIHLVALPTLDLVLPDLLTPTPGAAVQGTGATAIELKGAAEWGTIEWSVSGETGLTSLSVAGGILDAELSAPTGTFRLHLSDTAAPSTDPMNPDPTGAWFDNSPSYTIQGVTVNDTGALQPTAHQDATPPVVTFSGLPTHIGVATTGGTSTAFTVDIDDGTDFFDTSAVSITVELFTRDGGSHTWVLTHSGGMWGESVDPMTFPDGVGIQFDATMFTFGDRTPVVHDGPVSFDGEYPQAKHHASSISIPLTIDIPTGRYERFTVSVSAGDEVGRAAVDTDGISPVLRSVECEIPTDITLCLDRSGSMNGSTGGAETKWDATLAAANLFHTVFREIGPAIGGTTALDNLEGASFFRWSGGVDATTPPVLAPPAAGDFPSPGSPGGGTPIGSGVRQCADALAANTGWRRRIICLMTDGMENRGEEIAEIIAGAPNPVIPSILTDVDGVRLHGVTFGTTTNVDEVGVQNLVTHFGGTFHSTATETNPTDPESLLTRFASMFVDSIPSVDKSGFKDPASDPDVLVVPTSERVSVEDGTTRVVFVVAGAATGLRHAPLNPDGVTYGPSTDTTLTSSGTGAGISWFVVDSPAAGEYAVTGSDRWMCIFDLQLRTRFDVVASEVGEPITLRVTIDDFGRPVSGADVRVRIERPERSEGDLLVRHAKVKPLHPRYTKLRRVSRLGTHLRGRAGVDGVAGRAALLQAAAAYFQLPEQHHVSLGVVLSEVSPGVYEATIHGNSVEGSYSFHMEARGETASGSAFERANEQSVYLEAAPDPVQTVVAWTPPTHPKGPWILRVTPTQRSGAPVGPGIPFALASSERKKQFPLVDVGDGTYVAKLPAREAGLALAWRGRAIDLRTDAPRSHRRVRVTLSRIQTDEKHEAIRVFSAIAPAGRRVSAVTTLLPPTSVGDKKEIVFDEVVFDGILEEGTPLFVGFGIAEFDPRGYATHRKHDAPARYVRWLRGPIAKWEGLYQPRDEKPDPEELEDWRIWYRVEIL